MEKKSRYETPEFEVIDFGEEDIIKTSGDDPNEGPVISSGSMFSLF